jgi:hypothetical protein
MQSESELVRKNRPFVGNVHVGSSAGGASEPWTTEAARYMPYAWAGRTLLVYEEVRGGGVDLYGFTGPGRRHLIAADAFVVAVAPDAERLLVTTDRRMVEIVRVADGAVEASMALDGEGVAAPDSRSTPHYLMYSGSWRGDRVVANSDRGLVVLDVSDGIRIESVFATPRFEHGLYEPTFTDDAHVVGWANLAGRSHPFGESGEPTWDHALVSCDLATASCTVGQASPARMLTRWVQNPSR